MRYFKRLLLIIGFVVFCSSFFRGPLKEEIIQQRVEEQTGLLLSNLRQWLTTDMNSVHNNLTYYHRVRDCYKKIEAYVSFRYPELEKSMNGGPVPSVVTDIVILQKDDPHGLQVIEEIMGDFDVNSTNILKNEIFFLIHNTEKLKYSFEKFPLTVWEIIDANHQLLSRMMSLGLTGFDSPVLLRSLRDAKMGLLAMKVDLVQFKSIGEQDVFDAMMNGIDNGLKALDNSHDFNQFNRVDFYRNTLIPLQKAIREWHFSTEIETYEEVALKNRAINSKALHLFDEDYLNPYYTIRGNGTQPTEEQINLGKVLFYDPILSNSLKMSCSSCHSPNLAFSDGLKTSIDRDLDSKARNSPSLINSGYQGSFFWDLRSEDMNNQIFHVFDNEFEFNTTAEEVIKKLRGSKEYSDLFKQAYPGFNDPISISRVKSSLEVYVRSINALNSKFDQYIRGITNNLDEDIINGANLFLGKAACATCHFAPIFNGFVPPNYEESEGEIIGVTKNANSNEIDSDLGRFEIYKARYPEADFIKGMFKTPGIRNVQYTAPYMHNGEFKDLSEVVAFYNHGGALGKNIAWSQQTLASDSLQLSDADISDIVVFMNSLSDTTGTVVRPFKLPKHSDPLMNSRTWGGEKTLH